MKVNFNLLQYYDFFNYSINRFLTIFKKPSCKGGFFAPEASGDYEQLPVFLLQSHPVWHLANVIVHLLHFVIPSDGWLMSII